MFENTTYLRQMSPEYACALSESTPLEKYNCPNCIFKTSLFALLLKHTKESHSKEHETVRSPYVIRNYVCKSCTYQTYSSLHSLRHIRRGPCLPNYQKRIKIFKCTKCPYKAKKKSYLKSHEFNKHKKLLKCNYRTNTKRGTAMDQHAISKHTSESVIKWLRCDKCKFKSISCSKLSEHVRKKHIECIPREIRNKTKPVEKEKWFKCSRCPFKTLEKALLSEHTSLKQSISCSKLSEHVKKKHIECVPRKTRNKPKLVEKEKWYKCNRCPFKTLEKASLSEHTSLKHSEDDLWFACPHCPFKTTMENSVKRHVKSKHSDRKDVVVVGKKEETKKWLQCPHCKFKTTENLEEHVKNQHSEPQQPVQPVAGVTSGVQLMTMPMAMSTPMPYYYLVIQN